MTKCPNCGSTAQFKLIDKYFTKSDYEWHEKYKCGCGCLVEQRVQVRERLIYVNGKMTNYEHHH